MLFFCKTIRFRQVQLLLIASSCLSLFACDGSETNKYQEPPPAEVTVAIPSIQEITDYLEFTGTTAASQAIKVNARVSGILQSMHFDPGQDIEEGELLFLIEPSQYEAELEAAQAELASARAQFTRAQTEYERAQTLYKKNAGSESDVVKWKGEMDVAQAAILRAEAAVDNAELTLSYTEVRAPISGRVGRNLVDIGNLVGQGEATVLTDITQYDPMYVYIDLNENDLLVVDKLYRRKLQEKGITASRGDRRDIQLPMFLGLADEEGYPHMGEFDFGESGLDTDTGTVQLRAIFPNAEFPPRLYPGMFARVRMPILKRTDMPLIAEEAIAADQSGRYVLIVNRENVVDKRNIKTGQRFKGLRVVESGIKPDDLVVVQGTQRVRTGSKVKPQPIDMVSLSRVTE